MAEVVVKNLREARPGERREGRVSLVGMVSDDLRRRILEGALAIGDKLPSEAELTRQYAVSRTVVREAIAALRYDNMVEARQGAGVFVRNNQPAGSPFPLSDMARISSIIEILELRAAVEMEAAALAAARRSPAQEETIMERYDDIDALIAVGESTHDADMAFHLAIADATNNPRFREFLELLGKNAIPRAMLEPGGDATTKAYLLQIQQEHKHIAEAILARDEEAARRAVRVHLIGSQQRYRARLRPEG